AGEWRRASVAEPVPRVVELEANRASMDAVVVTCDSGEIAFEAIRRLLGQIEIGRVVIVDNASRPDYRARLREFESSRVLLVLHDRNLGFAAGVNAGLNRSDAPFAAIVNPDCIVDRGSIAALTEELESDSSVGLVGGLILDPDGREQAGARRDLPTRRHAIARWLGLAGPRWNFNHSDRPMPDHAIEVSAVSGAFMAVRRSSMRSVGGLDERYRMHFEDLDWCARFRAAGHRVRFVPHARAIHHKGSSSRARPIHVCFHKHRSMVLFDRVHSTSPWARRTRWLFAAGVWAGCGLSMLATLLRSMGGRRGDGAFAGRAAHSASISFDHRREPDGTSAA
ncbi:MAG: glycosyltransferase family 2 protein, partial [Phycisphaerales bacterium]